jgi:hypothetical protein
MKIGRKEFPLLSFFNFFPKLEIACNDWGGGREREKRLKAVHFAKEDILNL